MDLYGVEPNKVLFFLLGLLRGTVSEKAWEAAFRLIEAERIAQYEKELAPSSSAFAAKLRPVYEKASDALPTLREELEDKLVRGRAFPPVEFVVNELDAQLYPGATLAAFEAVRSLRVQAITIRIDGDATEAEAVLASALRARDFEPERAVILAKRLIG